MWGIEGLVAIGYERKHGPHSRLHQFLKLMYFSPVSLVVTCPLAMTDASAKLVEQLKHQGRSYEALDKILEGICSRDPKHFISSAQWMTERTGGSDVGNTETVAQKDPSGKTGREFLLNGYKYFTSATTSNVSFALARVLDEQGNSVKGSKGLSLFVTEVTSKESGEYEGIIVHRLKDKIGTKTLPTAELELVNKPALLVGEKGEGVKTISTLFNLTRVYCVMANVSAMNVMLQLMKDYSHKREAFGKKLGEHVLHVSGLADAEVAYRGMLQLLVEECVLLGKSENSDPTTAENCESMLRILTPIGKMFSGIVSSEMLLDGAESFGGAGYMEDTKLFVIFADAFVNRIWEGAGNVMALDLLRCLYKEPHTLGLFLDAISHNISTKHSKLASYASNISNVASEVKKYVSHVSSSPLLAESGAKQLCMTLGNLFVSSLLLRQASWSGSEEDIFTLQRWMELRPINSLIFPSKERISLQHSILFGAPSHKQERNDSAQSKL